MWTALNDWRARMLLRECNASYEVRDFKQAASMAGRAARVAASPGLRNLAMLLRTDYLLHDGHRDEATQLLKEAVAAGAGTVSFVHRKLARLLLAQHDFEGAIEHGHKSLEIDGPTADAFGILADAHLHLGRSEGARHWYQKAVAANPGDTHSGNMLRNLAAAASPAAADWTSDRVETILGLMKAGSGEVVFERRALEDGLVEGEGGDVGRLKQATALLRQQDLDGAEALLRPLCERCPDPYRAEFGMGPQMALRCWDVADFLLRAAERRSTGRELVWLPSIHPRAHFLMAQVARARGDTGSAIAWLEKGLRLEPGSPRFLNELGAVLAEAGVVPRALACYEEAARVQMAVRTDTATALRGAAAMLAKLGRLAEAEARLNEAKAFETAPKAAT